MRTYPFRSSLTRLSHYLFPIPRASLANRLVVPGYTPRRPSARARGDACACAATVTVAAAGSGGGGGSFTTTSLRLLLSPSSSMCGGVSPIALDRLAILLPHRAWTVIFHDSYRTLYSYTFFSLRITFARPRPPQLSLCAASQRGTRCLATQKMRVRPRAHASSKGKEDRGSSFNHMARLNGK